MSESGSDPGQFVAQWLNQELQHSADIDILEAIRDSTLQSSLDESQLFVRLRELGRPSNQTEKR